MTLTTFKVSGSDALSELESRRAQYPESGEYPFLIGDAEELSRLQECASSDQRSPEEIIQASHEINLEKWINERRAEISEYGYSVDDSLGDWPGEISEKGAISLHKDILDGTIIPEVYLGIVSIKEPWQLPAALKYGAWNDCPEPEVQCAFFRKWQSEFGVQITGMAGDVIECTVENPPRDQNSAMALASDQYWYCADIVEQGCETISNLGALLLNSSYWYFWWD